MKIQKISELQFKQIFAFNKQIFPQRTDAEAHFRFLFIDNPLVTDKSKPGGLIAVNEKEVIIGQFMLSPAEFQYQQQKVPCYFGCDYYVTEPYRNSGAGALLAMQAINGYKPYFTIGPSPDALQISVALKTRIIGELHKYIRLVNFTSPFKALLQQCKFHATGRKPALAVFPDLVETDGLVFNKITKPDDWQEINPQVNYLEFSRSRQFIKWRFFSQPDRYYIYQAGQVGGYLVCRTLNWHGLQLLALVDYRASLLNKHEFTAILKASVKIAAAAKLDGMMTMSSLAFFDKIMRKNGFMKIGRPQTVLTNAALDLPRNRIENRNMIFTTMADCDLDLNI